MKRNLPGGWSESRHCPRGAPAPAAGRVSHPWSARLRSAACPRRIRDLFQVRGRWKGWRSRCSSPRRDGCRGGDAAGRCPISTADTSTSAPIDADLGFHLLLCQLSENSVLVDAWRHLEAWYASILSDGDEQHSNIMSGSHHAPIVDAVEAGDVAQAVKVLQDHMMLAADRLASPAASR